MSFLQKATTLLELAAQPSFFGRYSRGVIPTTYCRLNQKWLTSRGIDTVLDIGANVGRFAITARAVFPEARIVAFEPLPACYTEASRAVERLGNAQALNVALGAESGAIEMTASEHSPSSSILPQAETHAEAFPFTKGGKRVSVDVNRLDDLAPSLQLGRTIFIKVDVQGFEKHVIAGGVETFGKADVALLELSYEELYEGQALFGDIFDQMRGLGFAFHGTMAQMAHPADGRLLDADCFFVRHR